MKKFLKWNLAVFAALALLLGGMSKADAIELGYYEAGFVVPVAFHNASDVDTVVSIISTCSSCTVYWTFFSKDSDHLYDSSLKLTKDDLGSFSLMEALGCDLVGEVGYLVFTSGDANGSIIDDCIAANAYIIDTARNDAIFIPVLPLEEGDYLPGLNLMAMNANSVTGADCGMPKGTTVDLRYWVDPAYGADTTLAVWTAENGDIGPATVNVYDDKEHRTSVTMCWKYKELNLWDPANTGATANSKCPADSAADFTAWPSGYVDGFLRLKMPAEGIAWSWVDSATIGAAQTFLGSEFDDGETDEF
jgi:hypothetical protein